MARRRNKKEEEEMDESWLLPYADILTLLLALFIVLYAMSSVDAQKFQELSQVFNSVFVGDEGVVDKGEAIQPDHPNQDTVDVPKDEKDDSKNDLEKQLEARQKYEKQENIELNKVKQRVDAYIAKNDLKGKFDTALSKEGLLITIRDNVLFESGSSNVRKRDEKTAKKLSKLLFMDPQREVIISGHTDNIPISNSEYESNWELSVTRALQFMKLILQDGKLNPSSFSAKGFGEYQPSASNKTKKGRAENRRVEIMVVANTHKKGE